ncbi:MAG: type IV pilus assembly protein PilM [Candidatus Omnitrophica bacterium]|nr:type IV pilus assembly protein PilM [Candidatus Omnitrophota bacterium]
MLPKLKQIKGNLDQEINLFEPGQKLVGIDIGSDLIKIAVLKEAPIGTRLISLACVEIPLPAAEETPEDVKKRINSAFKKAISQLTTKIKKVNTIIITPSLNIKNLSLPSMPAEELKESVRWEMEQNITYPIDTATVDFLVSGETIRSGAKNLELEVVAAQSEEINQFIQRYTRNKLIVSSINIPAFCLWNTFQKSNQWKEDDTIALVDIGAASTKISIFTKNILRFTREIFFGGKSLTQTLQKDHNLSYEEAENLKLRYGLSEASAYYSTIADTLKQLSGQMDRSFGYYKAQFHIERIDRLVIYGGTAKLINLDKFLTEELGIYAEIGLPLNGLLFNQKAFENIDDFSAFFAIAIGAALNSGNAKRINLLPADLRKDKSLGIKKTLCKIIPVILIFALFFIYGRLIDTEKTLTRDKVAKEEIISNWKEQQDFERKLKFLKSLPDNQETWIKIFRGISEIIPEGVWLNSITMEEKNKKIVLKGAGQTNILVLELVRKLESLPYFSSVMLESVEEKADLKNNTAITIYFKITVGKK